MENTFRIDMHKKIITTLLLGLLTLPAYGAIYDLTSTIDGFQSDTLSSGTGSASMSYDDLSGLFSWDISWSGMSGPATAMHFHGPAAPGVSAGVEVNIGAISGLTSPSAGSTTISSAQGADLLAELWYINIHTAEFGGGEIRGQVEVSAVPLPAAVWFFGTGLVSLFAARKYKAA